MRVQLPLLPLTVPVAERPRHLPSKQNRRVQLPPGTLGSLTRRRAPGPVGNRQTTLPQNEVCCGFNSHLGHSGRDEKCVGWARASPSGCNPPAMAVQVQLLPATLSDGLVAQLAEQDSLKVEVQGSTPCGATARLLGVSSNGKTSGLHPDNEGSIPSTVHWR